MILQCFSLVIGKKKETEPQEKIVVLRNVNTIWVGMNFVSKFATLSILLFEEAAEVVGVWRGEW